MKTKTLQAELIVTSTPIELHELLVDLIEKVRIYADVLPENTREIGVNLRAAALETERAALVIMRAEPELDDGEER